MLDTLGLSHDMNTGQVAMQKFCVESCRRRCNAIQRVPGSLASRRRHICSLVVPKFAWAAPFVRLDEKTLQLLRNGIQFAFLAPTLVDTPPVAVFALLGMKLDPFVATSVRALKAAFKFATCEPRWLEHLGLSFLSKGWSSLFPAARSVVTEHGWWITRDGLSVCRVMHMANFELSELASMATWLLKSGSSIKGGKRCFESVAGLSLHRTEVPGLAQGEDLPGPEPGKRCFFDGHRLLLEAATG